MKSWHWIILIILVLLIGIYSWLKLVQSKVSYKFKVTRFNLKGLNLLDLIGKGETSANLDYQLLIENKNNFSLDIKDFNIILYYDNIEIGKSSQGGKDLFIKAKDKNLFSDSISLNVNKNTIDILKSVQDKKPININYKVSMKIFGFPISFKDKYEFEQK